MLTGLAAYCHLAAGHADEAEASLKDALNRDPASATLLYAQATLHAQRGRAQAASRALTQARSAPHAAQLLAFSNDAEAAFDAVAAAAAN